MSVLSAVRDGGRARIAVLWACVGLFFLRVIGQVEVLLIAPPWLPPMSAWYSGLLPHPLLLPAVSLSHFTGYSRCSCWCYREPSGVKEEFVLALG